MAKISIGDSNDHSTTKLRVELSSSSKLELDVGAARGMSTREITILEQDESEISLQLFQLRLLVLELEKNLQNRDAKNLGHEAGVLAETVEKIVKEQTWYSVSMKGLLDAAKAVGEAASPLVACAVKVVELLQKIQH